MLIGRVPLNRHLGLSKDLSPSSRGFDKDFTFLPGAGNHYGFEPQLQDDVYFPALSSKGHWMEDGSPFDHEDLPHDFYSTKTFTDKLLEKLELRTEQEKQRPFFATLAYTAPHWPLQAPKHVVEKYRGMYDKGPDELAKSRLRRMIELGIASETEQAPPPVGNPAYGWDSMTADERARSARAMEVYAAMVEVVDDNVGRTLEYLRETGELDNTFVLFMSDNGAEGASLEAAPVSPVFHLFVSRQNPMRINFTDYGGHQDNVVHLREVLQQRHREHREPGLLRLVW